MENKKLIHTKHHCNVFNCYFANEYLVNENICCVDMPNCSYCAYNNKNLLLLKTLLNEEIVNKNKTKIN